MYDVIVIGAGPTGCTAAKTLSEKGYKILLVEKFELPRYKSCSGVLKKKTMELVKLYFGEDTPSFTMCTPTQNRGMIFTNDKGKEFKFEQDGLNVWRSSFDNWLSTKAAQSGVEVKDNTAVISCEEKEDCVSVTLHGATVYTEKAKYVIDCEGVIGSIKRKLLKLTPPYITTFQTFNDICQAVRLILMCFYRFHCDIFLPHKVYCDRIFLCQYINTFCFTLYYYITIQNIAQVLFLKFDIKKSGISTPDGYFFNLNCQTPALLHGF